MKYCPNCGEKVIENAVVHDKQKEVDYRHYSCSKGHNWKLMLDWYGGVSVIYEKDNLGRTLNLPMIRVPSPPQNEDVELQWIYG